MCPVLSMSQIIQVLRDAGWPERLVPLMASIAMRESRGVTCAFNGSGPDESYGIFQINLKGSIGPYRLNRWGITKEQLFDPLTCALAALDIWGGDDRNLAIAWAVGNAQYDAAAGVFLPEAVAAAALPGESYDSVAADIVDTGSSSGGPGGMGLVLVVLALGGVVWAYSKL